MNELIPPFEIAYPSELCFAICFGMQHSKPQSRARLVHPHRRWVEVYLSSWRVWVLLHCHRKKKCWTESVLDVVGAPDVNSSNSNFLKKKKYIYIYIYEM